MGHGCKNYKTLFLILDSPHKLAKVLEPSKTSHQSLIFVSKTGARSKALILGRLLHNSQISEKANNLKIINNLDFVFNVSENEKF
jgi:hypothetical protein